MKILRYIKTILIAGPMILFNHFVFNIKFARHPEKYSFEYRFKKAQKEIRFVLKLMHVDYKFDGLDKFYNLKEKGLIISNHLSDADPLILIANSTKPVTFISKIETFKFPFVGKIAKALEVFPLDRKNLMNQVGQIRDIVNFLKDPSKPSVIVYIEGTRNRHPETPCQDFHPGTLKIAMMAGVPLISVATYGTFRILDKKSYTPRVLTQFKVLNIRQPKDFKGANTNDLAVEMKKEIDKEVDNMRKIDVEFIKNQKMSKKRKEKELLVDQRVLS